MPLQRVLFLHHARSTHNFSTSIVFIKKYTQYLCYPTQNAKNNKRARRTNTKKIIDNVGAFAWKNAYVEYDKLFHFSEKRFCFRRKTWGVVL